ncbi:hypothetical protein HK097_000425 [Rhizophlyctis rosea]|uniref:Uncharacterized protein n=1 Tax=Rhizophlyctis rosea TaxID=64517 RepID=A0AAD5S845_9FUNG|nr:hypothetical protein HK097_000425 [Rhizophlyctis rosea]
MKSTVFLCRGTDEDPTECEGHKAGHVKQGMCPIHKSEKATRVLKQLVAAGELERVIVEGDAGSVVFFHPACSHGSTANRTQLVRKAYYPVHAPILYSEPGKGPAFPNNYDGYQSLAPNDLQAVAKSFRDRSGPAHAAHMFGGITKNDKVRDKPVLKLSLTSHETVSSFGKASYGLISRKTTEVNQELIGIFHAEKEERGTGD